MSSKVPYRFSGYRDPLVPIDSQTSCYFYTMIVVVWSSRHKDCFTSYGCILFIYTRSLQLKPANCTNAIFLSFIPEIVEQDQPGSTGTGTIETLSSAGDTGWQGFIFTRCKLPCQRHFILENQIIPEEYRIFSNPVELPPPLYFFFTIMIVNNK